MHWIVGGVQVQDNLRWRLVVRLQEQIHQQTIQPFRLVDDLLIARTGIGLLRRQFQAIQSALPGARFPTVLLPPPIGSGRFRLARQQGQQRVGPQLIVIVQILIAQRQADNPLRDQFAHRVLDSLRLPVIDEASRQPVDESQPPIHLPQQQTTRVAGHLSPVKPRHHLAPVQRRELKSRLGTLCHSRSRSLSDRNMLS